MSGRFAQYLSKSEIKTFRAQNKAFPGILSERIAEALALVPIATREVGNFDGSKIIFEGEGREGADAAPLGKVIDVHVEGETVMQTIDKAVVHDEVHAAMTAHATCILFEVGS